MSQAALAMSQATLSAVANAFAPIGLTDVVFRAGKDVIELLLKIHDSPTELSHLISSIQVLESAIAETRAYLDDFAASRFVSDDAAVPDITYILQRCQSEFDQLRRIADATTAGPNDSWLLLWRKKASFALNEKDIERSQRRLERYAYALDTALSANKGYVHLTFFRIQLCLVSSSSGWNPLDVPLPTGAEALPSRLSQGYHPAFGEQ